MMAFLSGHLSILAVVFEYPSRFLVKSKGTDPAGIFPLADFRYTTIELFN
jgi:hypothetical protein